MLTDLIKKVLINKEVVDQPFPTVPPHTHNSVDSPALAPGAVSSVNIKPGAVGESKLLDLSVTEEKLAAAAVATSKIKDDAVTAAKVWKGGSVITLSAQIAEAIILTAHIQDLAVKWAKIGNLEVGNSKIMDLAVSTGKIQDAAIETAKIKDLAVEWAKIGALSVGNSKIMDAAISTAKIQALAVTAAEIADATITNGKIGLLQVGNSRIMDAAISTAKIQSLAVTNAEVNDLNAAKVTAGLMLADRIWGGSGYFDYVQVRECGTEAVNVAGNINKTGTCNFSIPHPLKPGQRLIYTGIESAEVLLVERGSDQLQNGQKRIDFSDHFRAVSDPRKITAYLTPREDCKGLFLQETTNDHITVKEAGNGKSNAQFDYIVFTVRQGYYDYDFEPEDLTLQQNEGETTEAFKQRYHDHRIKLIRKKGCPDVDKKVAEFEEGWKSTYGRKQPYV